MGAVGSYLRHIETSADRDEFNQNIRRAADGLGPINPRATAEQIKQVFEEAQLADETRSINIQHSEEFVSLHPEFLDHTKNGAQFNKTLDAMFGANRAYSLDEFEKAYAVCLANNSLELDRAEIVKQQQAAAKENAKAARARRAAETRIFSEAELDSMSLEEVRQYEERQIQKRNQKIAEEGGYY